MTEASQPPVDTLAESEQLNPNRRNSITQAYKKFKSALRRIGTARDGRSKTSSSLATPIQTLEVDEEAENAQLHDLVHRPSLDQPVRSILEADPDADSNIDFSVRPMSLTNAANNGRLFELCQKYGLPYDEESLRPAAPNRDTSVGRLRVPKKTRQRVRVECHMCSTTFKTDRQCNNCGHTKCSDCQRQSPVQPLKSAQMANISISSDRASIQEEKRSLASSKRSLSPLRDTCIQPETIINTEPPDLPKPVIEKTRYVCHRCHGNFATVTNSICEHCGHSRCSRCSRQITRFQYPYTDILDSETSIKPVRAQRVYRPQRQRVRRFCDKCGSMFQAGSGVCSQCLHAHCESCHRQPAKKRRTDAAQPDNPAILQAVEARIAALTQTTAGPSRVETAAS